MPSGVNLISGKSRALPPSLKLLHSVELFADLERRELRILEPIIHERTYVPGEIIFEQGQEGLGMYVILSGTVRIVRRGPEGEHEIAQLGAGAFFGELALLDGAPRSATALARDEASLVGFFRPEFLDILETHGRIGTKISLALARLTGARLRKTLTGNPDCTSL